MSIMNIELLKVKGKNKKGDWLCGYPKIRRNRARIIVNNNDESYCVSYEVDINTICRNTGKKDRNGKYIYENDYVRYNDCKYPNPRALMTVRWSEKRCVWVIDAKLEPWSYDLNECPEEILMVIGNDHNNEVTRYE